MSGEAPTASSQAITLEALGKSFAKALGRRTLDKPAQSYLQQAFDDYAADETPEIAGEDLAVVLASVWQSALNRQSGDPAQITIGPLSGAGGRSTGCDVVQIIQDDRPFRS